VPPVERRIRAGMAWPGGVWLGMARQGLAGGVNKQSPVSAIAHGLAPGAD